MVQDTLGGYPRTSHSMPACKKTRNQLSTSSEIWHAGVSRKGGVPPSNNYYRHPLTPTGIFLAGGWGEYPPSQKWAANRILQPHLCIFVWNYHRMPPPGRDTWKRGGPGFGLNAWGVLPRPPPHAGGGVDPLRFFSGWGVGGAPPHSPVQTLHKPKKRRGSMNQSLVPGAGNARYRTHQQGQSRTHHQRYLCLHHDTDDPEYSGAGGRLAG